MLCNNNSISVQLKIGCKNSIVRQADGSRINYLAIMPMGEAIIAIGNGNECDFTI